MFRKYQLISTSQPTPSPLGQRTSPIHLEGTSLMATSRTEDKSVDLVKIDEIHRAVTLGNLRNVQQLIDRKRLAYCRDQMGATPLHKAVIYGQKEIIEWLLERFPSVLQAQDNRGRTPLHYAAVLPESADLYRMLVEAGADEKAHDMFGKKPQDYLNHQDAISATVLRENAIVTRPVGQKRSQKSASRIIDPKSWSKIHSSRSLMHRSSIRELIKQGNITTLEEIVIQGYGNRLIGETSSAPLVQEFLKNVPALIEQINELHKAAQRGNLEEVKSLLDRKGIVFARDQLGCTPLHKAAMYSQHETASYLSINYPATLDARDHDGRTALHYAAALDDDRVMYNMLIKNGASPVLPDYKRHSAEYYLRFRDQINLQQLIKRSQRLNANYSINMSNRVKSRSPRRTQDTSPAVSTENLGKSARSEKSVSSDQLASGSTSDEIQNLDLNPDVTENSGLDMNNQDNEATDKTVTSKMNQKELISMTDDPNESAIQVSEEQNEIEIDQSNNKTVDDDGPEGNVSADQIKEEASSENASEEVNQPEKVSQDLLIESKDTETSNDQLNNSESVKDPKSEENQEESSNQKTNEQEVELENDSEKVQEEDAKEQNVAFDSSDQPIPDQNADQSIEITTDNTDENQENDFSTQNEQNNENEGESQLTADSKQKVTSEESNEESNNNEDNSKELIDDDEDKIDINDKEQESAQILDENVTDDATQPGESLSLEGNEIADNSGQQEESEESEEIISGNKENIPETLDQIDKNSVSDDKLDNEHEVSKIEQNQQENSQDNDKVSAKEESSLNESNLSEKQNSNETLTEEETSAKSNHELSNEIEQEESDPEPPEVKIHETETNEPRKKSETTDILDNNENSLQTDEISKESENNDSDQKSAQKDEESSDQIQTETKDLDNLNDTKLDEIDSKTQTTEEIKRPKSKTSLKSKASGDSKSSRAPSGASVGNDDRLNELIETWLKEGDLLRLEHVVIAGQGERLIGKKSPIEAVQEFLDLTPAYMAKIKNVHDTVVRGNFNEVRQILTRKRFALSRDHVGASPLHLAVLHGHMDVLVYIITQFPETLDGPDNEGRTPLHYAAVMASKDQQYYDILKKAGANPNIADKLGHTADYYMEHPNDLTIGDLLSHYKRTGESVRKNPESVDVWQRPPTADIESRLTPSPSDSQLEEDPGPTHHEVLADVHVDARSEKSASVSGPTGGNPEDEEVKKEVETISVKFRETLKEEKNKLQQSIRKIMGSVPSQPPESLSSGDETDDKKSEETVSEYELCQVKDEHGQTVLHLVAGKPQKPVILYRMLTSAEYLIPERDEKYRTIRDVAVDSGLKTNVQVIDNYILDAFVRRNVGFVQRLSHEGYDLINVVDETGLDVTSVLRKRNITSMINLLQDITYFQKSREELHTFIKNDYIQGVIGLVDSDSTLVTAKNRRGRTSLHVAILFGNLDIISSLIDANLEAANVQDNMGRTPLHYAMATSKVEHIGKILIRAGANRQIRDVKMRTPSYYFVYNEDIRTIKMEEKTYS